MHSRQALQITQTTLLKSPVRGDLSSMDSEDLEKLSFASNFVKIIRHSRSNEILGPSINLPTDGALQLLGHLLD